MSPMNPRRLVPTQEPGVLDFAPGAAAAYSLRNLSYTYTGPVVTVRRSTDNAEADFTASEVSDGTLAGWAGADGFVKQWWDQSGNARHATQATTTAQPQIVDSGVLVTEGGKAAVQFDGVDDALAVPSSTAAFKFLHDGTLSGLFAVARFGSLASPGVLYSLIGLTGASSATTGAFVGYNDISPANDRLVVSVSRGVSGQPVFNSTVDNNIKPARQAMISLLFDVSSASVTERVRMHVDAGFVLNGNTFSYTPSSGNATHDMQIGSSGASTFPLLGTISEILIYPTDQTALRQRIEGNLAWTYNA